MLFRRKSAFTLIELLAAIAIIAALVAIIVPTVGNFLSQGKETSQKQTLAILNDAINRYKMQGGDLSALTAGKGVNHLLDALQAPQTWNGISHQFLSTSFTIPSSISIAATGSGKQYRLTQYDSYTEEPGGTPAPNVAPFSQANIVYWHDLDSTTPSYGSPTLTLQGAASFVDGYIVCSSAGDGATFSNPSGWPIAGAGPDRSLVARVRLHGAAPSNKDIIGRARDHVIWHSDGTIEGCVGTWSGSGPTSGVLPTDIWIHIVITLNGTTKESNLYINGNLVDTTTAGNASQSSGSWTLGGYGGIYQDVDISNFSLWQRELSQEEALYLYNSGNDLDYADL